MRRGEGWTRSSWVACFSTRSLRCMQGFLPMWLIGDQPSRSCMEKYEYMRAIGSRSVSTTRIVGAAAWKRAIVRLDMTM